MQKKLFIISAIIYESCALANAGNITHFFKILHKILTNINGNKQQIISVKF